MWKIALIVGRKDLLIEWRSRVVLWQVIPFGVIALVLCALAVGPDAHNMRRAAPGLFYVIVLLLALLTIGRSHSIESRTGTKTSVRMLGMDPAGVFLGKAGALFVELFITSVVVLAGVVVGMHTAFGATLRAAPSLLLALGALSAGGTMYGVLLGDTKTNATLLPVLALPPFTAILIAGERAFSSVLDGGSPWRWLGFLGFALAAYGAAGVVLYGVAEDS